MKHMLNLAERKVQSINGDKLVSIVKRKINDFFSIEDYEQWLQGFIKDSNFSYEMFLKTHNKTEIKVMNYQILIKLNLELPVGSGEKIFDFMYWLKDDLKKYGWFVSTPYDDNLEEIAYEYRDTNKRILKLKILLEPFYGEMIEVLPRILYHLSSAYNTESILKKGLIPRSYEKMTQYPDRVYVLLSIDRIKDLIYGMIENEFPLYDIYAGNIKAPQFAGIDKFVNLFEIDTSKLRKGIKFFKDPDMPTGAWTYTHIPSKAIKLLDINKV